MHRVTITIDEPLMSQLDQLIAVRGYQNRSEAIRDLARAGMEQANAEITADRDCVAALVYVYDHTIRELPKRLASSLHDHHDKAVSTLHVHLDHRSCMEVTVLKGKAIEVRHFADHVVAERGVRYGRLVTVPVELAEEAHCHGGPKSRRHEHAHVK